MGSDIVDYIILIVIFVVTIHVIFHMFGKPCKGKEHLNEQRAPEITQSQPPNLFDSMHSIQDNRVPSKSLDIGSNSVSSIQSNIVASKSLDIGSDSVSLMQDDTGKHRIGHSEVLPEPVNEMDIAVNDYLKNKVFVTTPDNCAQVPSGQVEPFSPSDIAKYRNKILSFEQTINRSSNEGNNTGDVINALYAEGNNELVNMKGKTIADVYDGMTKSIYDRDKQCKYAKCIIPPKKAKNNEIFGTTETYHMTSDGSAFSGVMRRYEHDSVSTGGEWYDDIEGTDPNFEHNPVVPEYV